jgi:RNA polymerase sigma-70 factor (ECF subfamily)
MHADPNEARRAVEATARQGYGKLVAWLAARTRDLAAAEDALADAFAAALAAWPGEGVPASPEAWLLTVARRKAIDDARRQRTRADAAGVLQLLAGEAQDAGEGEGTPRSPPRPRVRLRAPRHRARGTRAADAPGGARLRRRRGSPPPS